MDDRETALLRRWQVLDHESFIPSLQRGFDSASPADTPSVLDLKFESSGLEDQDHSSPNMKGVLKACNKAIHIVRPQSCLPRASHRPFTDYDSLYGQKVVDSSGEGTPMLFPRLEQILSSNHKKFCRKMDKGENVSSILMDPRRFYAPSDSGGIPEFIPPNPYLSALGADLPPSTTISLPLGHLQKLERLAKGALNTASYSW